MNEYYWLPLSLGGALLLMAILACWGRDTKAVKMALEVDLAYKQSFYPVTEDDLDDLDGVVKALKEART